MLARFITYKAAVSLSLLLTAAYAQASPSTDSNLEGVTLGPQDMSKASQPIGSLSGTWSGTWGDFQVELNHSVEPTTMVMTLKPGHKDDKNKRVVVTAEFTRKGRLITLGETSCLRQVDQRQWVISRQGCPGIRAGNVFELVRGKAQQWLLRAGNALIPLSRD